MSKTEKHKLKPKTAATLPRVLQSFRPYVAEWFIRTFNAPSPAQKKAWPAIRRGDNTLLLAPSPDVELMPARPPATFTREGLLKDEWIKWVLVDAQGRADRE